MFYVVPFSCFGSARNELIVRIFQKTGAFLSIVGSSLIVSDVAKKVRNGRETDPYQRIMLGISIFDILLSFLFYFLGTWMVPKETGWLWAAGNTSSCSAQGFFFVFGGFGEILYQAAISLNILLLIVFGWNQETFSKKVEKPMHFIIIAFVLVFAIIPLVYETYNPACGECVPGVLLGKCSTKDEGELCIVRGNEQVQLVLQLIAGASILIVLIFCTVVMVWVYLHVRRQEMRNRRYNFGGSNNAENHRESRRIRKILFLYTLSLYFSYGSFLVAVFIIGGTISESIATTLIPLLGFWNMLVYFLPNCLKYQRDHPGTWLVTAYFQVLRPAPCAWSPSGMCAGQKEELEDAPEMNFAKFNTTNEQPATTPVDSATQNNDLE
uniref:G-protein coupled receptors family 1 profile domain-containing protein n=1 Tax=Ditylum brightwellii TaxID=49249 RepID=A0A7S2A1N2_9STRA|mmetsp:Transcript_6684/g.10109  ORF Transcript_6684/g.10109 Transcript_6684/m.10109 type:complete len:381 (+) Transcript_6684:145-1287(+)